MKITFDIGGTNMRAASFTQENKIAQKLSKVTPQSYIQGLAQIVSFIQQLQRPDDPPEIVISVAGSLKKPQGSIVISNNLPDWSGKPFAADLASSLSCSVVVENDSVLAGLGEAVFGAGKGKRIVAFLTLSTGVGGARIVEGKLDANAWGFEPGNQIINVHESKRVANFVLGSLESYTSGTAFRELYRVAPESCDDPAVWEQFATHLAAGLINVMTLWSPDVIVLGGGLCRSAEKFLPKVEPRLRELAVFSERPPIMIGSLGDEAGLYGGLTLPASG